MNQPPTAPHAPGTVPPSAAPPAPTYATPPGFPPPPGQGPSPQGYGPPHPGVPAGTDSWAPVAAPVTRTTTLAGVLQLVAAVLVPLGAALPFGDGFSSAAPWATTTTWAVFATAAALVQLAPLIGRFQQRPATHSWRIGAVGVGALTAFWVLIVLPGISSGQNFVLTMGAFAAALGLWLSPGRQL